MPVDATATVEEVYAETRSHFLPQVVFVLGGPGSGKGTQCARIKEEFGYVHLSMGDLLRAEVASGSELGREMEATMREGGLVPTDTTVVLLREAMRRSPGNRFLIDGFPRAREQSEAFERLVGQPKFVLFFDCPEATMRSRLLERGKTSGRADDNEEAIMKRFVTFQEQSLPAITDYKGRGLLKEISAVPSKDAVYQGVRKLFQPELVVMCGASGSGRGEFTSRAGLQLGYHTLRVPKLLEEEAARDTPRAAAVRRALGMHRTCPLDATVQVLREAMARSTATRFILDGFPRLTSEGFPSVHDQVFALEESVGPVRGCVCLDAHLAQRKARILGVPTVGQEAALARSVNAFKREKLPVVAYFEAIGKTRVVDTTPPPDEVFQAAAPFLE
jgi:adenylate kinase